jgi:hypothetical protein
MYLLESQCSETERRKIMEVCRSIMRCNSEGSDSCSGSDSSSGSDFSGFSDEDIFSESAASTPPQTPPILPPKTTTKISPALAGSNLPKQKSNYRSSFSKRKNKSKLTILIAKK